MGVLESVIGGGTGIIGAGINAWSQQRTNKKNEALMRESWARDDTAVQRRAADLEAAGMNPLLAAGGAAQSGSPIKLDAPQYGDIATGAIEGAQKANAIATTQAQTQLIKNQADKVNEEKQGVKIDNVLKSQTLGSDVANAALKVELAELAKLSAQKDVDRKEIDNQLKKVELEVQKKYGLSSADAKLVAEQMDNYIKGYNADYFKSIGMPISPGGSADIWTRAAGVLSQGAGAVLGDPLDKLVDNLINNKKKTDAEIEALRKTAPVHNPVNRPQQYR